MLPTGDKYNIELSKGTGLVSETLALLTVYNPTQSKSELTENVISSDILVKNSPARIKDIVQIGFYKRYMKDDSTIPMHLKSLYEAHLSIEVLSQIFLIYTVRANPILRDFIKEIYWPSVKNGADKIDFTDSRKFIEDKIKFSDKISGWSESTQKRMASYLIATLVDFRLLAKTRKILPFFMKDITAEYLAHDLHFSGLGDNSLLASPDWETFGYSNFETVSHLERLSFQGAFIFQHSGEMVNIEWNYLTFEEFINGIRHKI